MKQQRFIKIFIWLFHLTYLREVKLIAWRDVFPQDFHLTPQDSSSTHTQAQQTQLQSDKPAPANLHSTQNLAIQQNPQAPHPRILLHTKDIRLDSTHRYLALLSHRNGAFDGWVYGRFIPRFVFMMAKQLHKFWWLRAIFPGIAITRQKDDPLHYKKANLNALKACVQVLQNRQILCIFPEGTSSLGHKHLPFEQGAARLAMMSQKTPLESAQSSHTPLYILPMSVFYDDPTLLGGKAFVIYNEPFICPKDMDLEQLHTLFSQKLEQILLEYESQESQEMAHFFASFLSSNTAFTDYYANLIWLKSLQNTAQDSSTFTKIVNLTQTYRKTPLPKLYKKAPIYPQSFLLSLWTFSICLPIVALSFLLNLPPLLCGNLAAKLFAKEEHTISLWKVIIGYGVGFVWWGGILLTSGICGAFGMYDKLFTFLHNGRDSTLLDSVLGCGAGILLTLIACGLGIWGLKLYGAFKKHSIALYNACFHYKRFKMYKNFKNKLLGILN